MEILRNRIHPSGMKRVTAQDAPKRQKTALQSAKAFDCLQRVGRTGGIKSAGGYSLSLDRYFRYIRIIQSIHFLIIFHKSQFLQMFLQNRCDLSRFCKGGFGPSDQNNIIAFFDLFFQRHKCRRDDSPCPVPLDCVSNFFGSGNAESGLTCAVFTA